MIGLTQRITDAVEAKILTNEEAGFLRLADEATERAIAVDDFEFGALARQVAPVKGKHTQAAE